MKILPLPGIRALVLSILAALSFSLSSAEVQSKRNWSAQPAPHPWLFLTSADVQRARDGIKQNAAFRELARNLTEAATTNQIGTLPPLETNWWTAILKKPWKETYPEIYHHTWRVPGQWSALARNCARASVLNRSNELAAKGKQVLLRLSAYSFEFEHFDVGMNYTVWGAETLEAYDLLYGRFDETERAEMDAFFMRMLAAVQKSDAYWVAEEPGGTINNHYAWHKLCYVMLGCFYGHSDLIEQAFHGPKGIDFMLQHGFKDEGLWIEGSIPYQFAAAEPLLQIAELMENRSAIDQKKHPKHGVTGNSASLSLYALERDGRTLAQSYMALLELLWPDCTLPTVGDAYARRPHLGTHPDFEFLFRRFRDPAFGWLLADREQRSSEALFAGLPVLKPALAPAQKSKLWPEMGYVALRSCEGTKYWNGSGWSAFATFSHRPIHQHADKLSISLFGEGRLWLPDIEARSSAEHAFSSVVQSELNRQTLSHNTLLVDNESQHVPRQRLDLVEFSCLPHVKRATFGDLHGQLYAGVRQLRTVIVTTNYVVDFFQLQSDQPHEVAWLTHVDGQSANSSITNFGAMNLPEGRAYSYLREPQSADAGKHFSETFTAGNGSFRSTNRFQLDLWSNEGFSIVRCGYPLDETPKPATIPMRLAQAKTANAWFLAVYRLNSTALPLDAAVKPGPLGTWEISLHSNGVSARDPLSGAVTHIVPRLLPSL